jgi:UDP-N-acetylglucosamine transferase subunit ALG13
VIFVTLGTHEQPFGRAIDMVAELADTGSEEILVQHGATPSRNDLDGVQWFDYLPWDDLSQRMQEAEAVITHAGVGSTVTAIQSGKKPVLIPRLARFGEHVDDHQLQLAERFEARGLGLVCGDSDDIRAAAQDARTSPAPAVGGRRAGLSRAVARAASTPEGVLSSAAGPVRGRRRLRSGPRWRIGR